MKKLTKKLLLVVLSTFTLFGLTMSIGCDCGDTGSQGGGGDIPSSPITAEVSLSATNLKMIVGDYYTISTSTNKAPGLTVELSSENESIATINKHGLIEAVNQGTTNIVAKYGDVTAKCAITVEFDDSMPEIIDLSSFNNEYVLYKGETVTFEPAIRYRDRIYTDGEFNFVSANEDVVAFDGTTLKAGNNVNVVNCYVEGSWRGFDVSNSQSLRKDFTVKVMTEAYISLEGTSEDFIELYTHEEFGGNQYVKSSEFKPVFYVEGQAVEGVEFDFTYENAEILDLNGDLLTAKSYGQAKILVSCEYEQVEYVKTINVNVVRPEAEYEKKLNFFSTGLGTFKDKDDNYVEKTIANKIYGSDDVIILEALQDKMPLSVKDNKILGIQGATSEAHNTTIKISTATEIYYVSLQVYGLYIMYKEDLTFFSTQAELNDYYYLANDIDATDYTLPLFVAEGDTANKNYGSARTGLTGVFEGNGHIIKGLTVGSKGMFSNVSSGTIQNIAFTDVKLTGYYPCLIAHKEEGNSKLKNIYVQFTDIAKKGAGFYQQKLSTSGVHENIVIEYGISAQAVLDKVSSSSSNDGNVSTFAPQRSQTWSTKADTLFKNCFSISYAPIGLSQPRSTDYSWSSYVVAENQVIQTENEATGRIGLEFISDFDKELLPLTGFNPIKKTETQENAIEVAKGIKAYHTIADLQADKDANAKILETFDFTYWVVENGVPYWKGVYVSTFDVSIKNGETPVDGDVVLSNDTTELTVSIVDANGNPVETTITGVEGVVVNGNKIKLASAPTSKGSYEIIATAIVKGVVIEKVVTIGYSDEIEVGGKVLYSADDRALNLDTLNKALASVDVETVTLDDIDSYLVNGEEMDVLDLEVIISNNSKVNQGRSRAVDVAQEVTLVIDGKKVILNNVYAYTKVIDEAEDLKYFTMNYHNQYNEVDGYFVLAKNIDASALELDAHQFEANKNGGTTPYPGDGVSVDVGFRGVLDGQGYTVDSLTAKSCGLFAGMNAPVVKNIAFTNVKLTGYYPALFSKKYSRGKDYAGSFNGYEGLFENIYISINSIDHTGSTSAVGVLVQGTLPGSAHLRNVVVDFLNVDETTQAKINDGNQFLMFGSCGASMAKYVNAYKDCYAITTAPVLQLKKMPGFAENQVEYTVTGSNVTAVGNVLDSKVNDILTRCGKTLDVAHVIIGLKAYDNYTAMANANNDYSSFSSDYWTIVNGVPVWTTAN